MGRVGRLSLAVSFIMCAGIALSEPLALGVDGAGELRLSLPGFTLVELTEASSSLGPWLGPLSSPAASSTEASPTLVPASFISMDDVARFSIGNMSSRVWSPPRVVERIGALSSPNTAGFYRDNRDFASCERFRSAYGDAGLPSFTGLETIIEIDNFVKNRMRYRSEGMSDRWVNYAGEVLSGRKVGGDCDDAAITAAALAICGGAPAERVGFAIFNAQTYGKQNANHIVATYTAPNGVTVAFGDTNDGVVWNLADKNVRPKFTASAADISVWLKH